MYAKDERAETFTSWMIASGARLDPPDPRHLGHLVALRDSRRETVQSSSPFARVAAWLGRPSLFGASPTATTNSTTCCAPA